MLVSGSKNEETNIHIDLLGPEGNAFVLIATIKKIMRKEGRAVELKDASDFFEENLDITDLFESFEDIIAFCEVHYPELFVFYNYEEVVDEEKLRQSVDWFQGNQTNLI